MQALTMQLQKVPATTEKSQQALTMQLATTESPSGKTQIRTAFSCAPYGLHLLAR